LILTCFRCLVQCNTNKNPVFSTRCRYEVFKPMENVFSVYLFVPFWSFFFIFYFSFSFFSLLSFLRCQWVDWWRTVFFSVFIFSDWECCIFIRSLSNTSFDRSHSFCFFSFLRCQYKSFACVFNSNDDNNHFSWITSNVSINEKTYRDYRACLWLPRMLNWENKCQI